MKLSKLNLFLLLSLFSSSAFSLTNYINYHRQPAQVLGETTINSKGIPCSYINQIQKQYCSAPQPYPTKINPPTPTPVTCKTGLNSIGVSDLCTGSKLYQQANYSCYDGSTGTIREGTCYSYDQFKSMATSRCSGKSNCLSPTPTHLPYPTPIPTKINYPTSTPTRAITPTKAPIKLVPNDIQ